MKMKVDMSPAVVTWRLKMTSELRRLCLALAGKRLEPPPPPGSRGAREAGGTGAKS